MNRKKVLFLLGICISLLTTSSFADDIKAREIMERVDARDDGKTLSENMLMILIDKNGKRRVRHLKSYSKDFGEDEYKILFFQSPSDVKNTAFLTYDYDDSSKDDDQWLYLPALKKVKRIPSADKSSSFMGSDFSYFDMTDRNLDDYDFKLLKEIKVRGHDAWMIESIPKNQKTIDESGYNKSIAIIRKDNYMVVRAINFMRSGKRKYFDIKKLHQEDGVWLVDKMTMTTKKGKDTVHQTVITFDNIKLNREIKDDMFTTRRLEKGI